MKTHRHRETSYIRLNTHQCKACWDCVTACPQNVLGKVDLPFHKHARVDQAEKCKGCLCCINGAIQSKEKTHGNLS
jgi:2-oxoglutarate ferredoxin oxidoreductase subunit delta